MTDVPDGVTVVEPVSTMGPSVVTEPPEKNWPLMTNVPMLNVPGCDGARTTAGETSVMPGGLALAAAAGSIASATASKASVETRVPNGRVTPELAGLPHRNP